MQKYIVEKKGLFGTLYVASFSYGTFPVTTRNKESAYKFSNPDKAEKFARKLWGEVIEINDSEDDSKEEIEKE